MSKNMKEITQVVCPYCDDVKDETGDSHWDGETTNYFCGECNRNFLLTYHMEYSYTMEKV